jgi:hydroxyacylglutathione hydrolase
MSRADFITLATLDLPTPPQYFGHDVSLNKGKAQSVEDVLKTAFNPMDIPSLDEIKAQGIILLDTRTAKEYEAGFIPGSLSLPLSINFAIWAGTLFKPETKFFVIANFGKEKEAIVRLARIGYDKIVGVLKGGFEAYKASGEPLETIRSVEAADVTPDMIIYDIRNPPELEHGHIENVRNVPLIEINKKALEGDIESLIPKDTPIYIHCKGGARSIMACSILKRAGYQNHNNINGGFDAIKKDNQQVKII